MLKKLILISIFVLGQFTSGFCQKNTGEIININYEYEIAFTDLSEDYLQVKDIVEIIKDGKFVTYLQVSQTSPAISRLIPITENSKYTTKIDFKNITVGSTVIKVASDSKGQNVSKAINNLQNGENKPSLNDFPNEEDIVSLNEKVKVLSENYVRLSKSLSDMLDEKKQIESELLKYKDEMKDLISENKVLESKNHDLESTNKNLEAKSASLENDLKDLRDKNADNCNSCKNEVVILKDKIEFLKAKLKEINNLIKNEGLK